MISRKSTLSLAEVYVERFSCTDVYGGTKIDGDKVYDFLFENDFEGWFYNIMKTCTYTREFKERVAKLHTGETLFEVTSDWSWEQREKLGQRHLLDLAKALFTNADFFSRLTTSMQKLIHNLELDVIYCKNLGYWLRRAMCLMLNKRLHC